MHTDSGSFSVIQIVGYKNSGKTTLMQHLIGELSSLGVRVGSIKHHGHGGKPARAEQTDSSSYLEAGAAASAVLGEGEWQLTLTNRAPLSLEGMIRLQRTAGAELVLIEGFKQEAHPKIVMLRDEADEDLMQLENIIAIGGWNQPLMNTGLFAFSLNNFANYKDKMLEFIMSR